MIYWASPIATTIGFIILGVGFLIGVYVLLRSAVEHLAERKIHNELKWLNQYIIRNTNKINELTDEVNQLSDDIELLVTAMHKKKGKK